MTGPQPTARLSTVLLSLLLALQIAGCGRGGDHKAKQQDSLHQSWPQIVKAARGTTVMFLAGGDTGYEHYIDDYVTPALKKKYDITLKRVPVAGAATVFNKILAEKQAGRQRGSIDMIWINGENFASGARAGLWQNDWARDLPNSRLIDWDSGSINHDFGFPVEAREAPWSRAQMVMIYDSAEIKQPPTTLSALLAWAKAHPGRLSYPAPPDFTGTAFIEQALILLSGKTYQQSFDKKLYVEQSPALWQYLNQLKPYLWRGGKTYPASAAKLDELFQNGEVSMTMSYNPQSAQRHVNKGLYPKTTRTFVFDGGTVNNTSYITIPFNAPNKAGAAVATNFLESPAAQIEKQKPSVVGALTVLDLKRLPPAQQKALSLTGGSATLPMAVLEKHRLLEANYSWVGPLQKGWEAHVARP